MGPCRIHLANVSSIIFIIFGSGWKLMASSLEPSQRVFEIDCFHRDSDGIRATRFSLVIALIYRCHGRDSLPLWDLARSEDVC